MAALTLRSAVGRPLTNSEVDANFTNLNAELSGKQAALGFAPYNSTNPSGFITATTPTITGLREVRVIMSANNIDLLAGNYFSRSISGATTLTVSNVQASGISHSFILDLTNGGSATIAWWSGVRWASGSAPTLTSSGRDVLGFFTHDGGANWTGLLLGKDVR